MPKKVDDRELSETFQEKATEQASVVGCLLFSFLVTLADNHAGSWQPVDGRTGRKL